MIDNVVQVDSDGVASETVTADTSWIGGVTTERDKQLEEEGLKLGVPTWGTPQYPTLVFEYQVIDRERVVEFTKEAQRRAALAKKAGVKADANQGDMGFICESVKAVYVRSPEDEKLYKVVDDHGREVRVTKRLGEALRVSEEHNANSHSLLAYLVRTKDGKPNGMALANLAATIAKWMLNTTAEVEDAVLGE